MLDREYLLACSYCDEYTMLHRYLPKEGRFQGEYSLLHNRYTEDDRLLCKFLLAHVGHPVRLIPNRTDEFSNMIARFHRFSVEDIDRYVEESKHREKDEEQDRNFDRGLGQLQIMIIQKLLHEEAEALSRTPSGPKDAQFLLGKQMGIEWANRTIEDVLKRGSLPEPGKQ